MDHANNNNSPNTKTVTAESVKDNSYSSAAFSLASLQEGNNGSKTNVSFNFFDTAMFLKSGSFDQLQLVCGSQIFKQDPSISEAVKLEAVKNLASSIQPQVATPVPITNSSSGIAPSPMKSMISSSSATSIPSTVLTTSVPNGQINMQPQATFPPYGNNALIQPKENDKRIVEKRDDNSKFVDVTPYLTLPQHEAAKKLGIPSSTLAKRWKEASCNRKWPYRTVSKLDKEILTLLKNVENAKTELSPSVEATLGVLLRKRQEELKTVLVRL